MTITAPPNVAYALSLIGITWPDTDEDKIYNLGDAWMAVSRELGAVADAMDTHARTLWNTGLGVGVEAFRLKWTESDAPSATIRDGARAAALIADGLYTAYKIVVAYKLKIIAEIASLAVSAGVMVYGAFYTFGAALLAAPLLRWATRVAIDELTSLAVQSVLKGELL